MGAAWMKHMNVIVKIWGVVLLAISPAGHAYTVNECVEKWYPEAKPGQRIFELHPEKTGYCRNRKVNMKSERLAEIDGKGYFISCSKNETHACPRAGVGIPIPACVLPKALQRNVVGETRKYYLVTPHGPDLRPLGHSLYSTDGRTVFLFSTPIKDADPATFEPLDTTESDAYGDWAQDRTHVYHNDTPMPEMVPGEVKFAGPFVTNAGQVFQVDLSKVYKRPDVLPSLKLLVAEAPRHRSLVSDGQRIFLRGEALDSLDRLDGLFGANLETLNPTCPVAGHPDLRCLKQHPYFSETPKQSRLSRTGDDVLYFRNHKDVVRIVSVPDFVFFRPKETELVLGISGQRLFYISGYGSQSGTEITFVGNISGPIAGALVDEEGFITPFPKSDLRKCSSSNHLPKTGDSIRLGSLRQLPDTEVPEGFAVALENERYRYLFASREKRTSRDTVIDLRNGRRIFADCQ
jgi:hypothetical protein